MTEADYNLPLPWGEREKRLSLNHWSYSPGLLSGYVVEEARRSRSFGILDHYLGHALAYR